MLLQLALFSIVLLSSGSCYGVNRRPPKEIHQILRRRPEYSWSYGSSVSSSSSSAVSSSFSSYQPSYNTFQHAGCEEAQNFGECEVNNILELFGRNGKEVFSYNAATGTCEPVKRLCSKTTANKFRTKEKCQKYCTGKNQGCYKERTWYEDGEVMDSKGCCKCWDGVMACFACHEATDVKSWNEIPFEVPTK